MVQAHSEQGSDPMTIHETFRAKHPKSAALAERARKAIPGGITHDIRHLAPYPVYVERAAGTRKWDVDGLEYIDYWMGHGALFLGHCHPAVVKAVQEQMARGTHLGASHALEVRWAELVNQLVPCAELTRFTMSGTEATHLALRVARAYTGRPRVVKLAGHFHGWHDGVVAGVAPPYDVPLSAGVPGATVDQVIVAPANDVKAVEVALDRGDVAAVILEPAGGSSGTIPTIPGYLQELRELTRDRGVVLIFDEVISGFRYAPGGAQAYYGVTPDLTTLAKIVAGGLPGGALCGSREIMSMMAHRGDPVWDRAQRVAHAGTFNANPLSAAAAIATLELCADASLQARASKAGEALRRGLADALRRAGAPGTCYGEASIYHVSFEGVPGLAGFDRPRRGDLYQLLRCALLNHGVDCSANHGWVSTMHTDEDIEKTVEAYERAFRAMVADHAFDPR
jgi:glutamate-1-semialdehyde 2,1-aminomutase